MSAKETVARNLASAFLAGTWSQKSMVARAAQAWGGRDRVLSFLARRVLAAFGDWPDPPHVETLAKLIYDDDVFDRAWSKICRGDALYHGVRNSEGLELPLRRMYWVNPAMRPAPGVPQSWQVPPLATLGALAEWLNVKPGELDWLSGRFGRRTSAAQGPLSHYTYRWLAKPSGQPRLLEMPKHRLKGIQRLVLREILDRIPPHEAVHGYRRGRSVRTYVEPHAGRRIVVHLDLRDFFPSVPASRVHAVFAVAGYPRTVARVLTALCTNVVPDHVLHAASRRLGRASREEPNRLFRSPHLPQGAPTSPALANVCAYRFDCRVAGLARKLGASYTRYADDLAFSGDRVFERGARRFQVQVCRIALEEGFEVHTRKTRFMRQAVRQQVGGIVLNVRPNIRRSDLDTLKAILHNCARAGPASQNRDGHADFRAYLAGRLAYVKMIHPAHAERLRELFERIRWHDD